MKNLAIVKKRENKREKAPTRHTGCGQTLILVLPLSLIHLILPLERLFSLYYVHTSEQLEMIAASKLTLGLRSPILTT